MPLLSSALRRAPQLPLQQDPALTASLPVVGPLALPLNLHLPMPLLLALLQRGLRNIRSLPSRLLPTLQHLHKHMLHRKLKKGPALTTVGLRVKPLDLPLSLPLCLPRDSLALP